MFVLDFKVEMEWKESKVVVGNLTHSLGKATRLDWIGLDSGIGLMRDYR